VTIDPDLDRVGKVGAYLNEARAKLGVDDVEIVDRDPAVGLGEPIVDRPGHIECAAGSQ
jgi:hypothetical protein